jgi:hypothetical protein
MHRIIVRSIAALLIVAAVMMLGEAAHELIPHEWAHATGGHAVAEAQGIPDHYCAPERHDASRWHLPYIYNSDQDWCYYGHEHGGAPPQWIADAGYEAGFDQHGGFHGNTSHAENTDKHAAMKGYLVDVTDYAGGAQQVYFRVHIASNAMDRTAKNHSYEVFMRDAAGGVSHWQGYFDAGDPSTKRFLYNGRNDPGLNFRPLIFTQDETTFATVKNEHWYVRASVGWNWDFAWTLDPTTFWRYDEKYDTDVSHWPVTGRLGTVRRIEPAWYGPDSRVTVNRGNPPRGVVFWATALGEFVTGPEDPRCIGSVPCLPQFIATTARSVESGVPGGNARERVFPGIGLGVRLPN